MSAPLDLLLADGVIDEILGRLKSGKEADISLVSHRGQVLAAKVYKDRATRSFKNNADYKEGRKTRNSRTARAMETGGRFGRDAAEQAWKSAESSALSKLIAHGVRVPKPVMFYEGVLLMELVLDAEGRPAPRLIDVALDPDAAAAVFADLRGQIIAMLCCDLIHGDLSPYNILAAAAGPTIIDFPQVISAAHSSRAQFFFQRDFDNVLHYVVGANPALARHASDGPAIWRAYTGRFLTPGFVPPPPRPPPPPQRRPEPRRSDVRRPEPRGADPRRVEPRSDEPRRADPRGPQRPNEPRGPQRPNEPRGPQRPNEPRGPQQRANEPRGPQQRANEPRGPQQRANEPRGPQRPNEPRGPQRPNEPRGPQQRANEPRGPQQRANEPRGPQQQRANDPRPPTHRADPRPAPPRFEPRPPPRPPPRPDVRPASSDDHSSSPGRPARRRPRRRG